MHYFTMENGEMKLNVVNQFSAELEEIYRIARQTYTVDYHLSDWADDDSDSGMGYCYDNSYDMKREPFREEMVFQDGILVGFYVGRILPYMKKEDFILSPKDTKKYFLELTEGKCVSDDRQPYSKRYADYESWEMIVEKEPKACEYAFLLSVPQADKEYTFTATDFSEEMVEEVVKQICIEDSRGHFDNAFRVKLKLKPEASKQPERVLEEFSKFRAVLVRN